MAQSQTLVRKTLLMDSLLTPLPGGKAKDSKPKINQKGNQAAKMGTGEPRQNRVFGTARSTNIQGPKPVWDKSFTKTKTAIPQKQVKQPKPIRATQVPADTTTAITQSTEKKSPENVNPRLNMKSDTFPQRLAEKTSKNSQENDSAEPKTPVTSSSHGRASKSKVPATPPFYTAVHCSKCRFDKLETSSYWVGQIKLAESVGKHFVAYHSFKLGLECQAEPIRNLRIELKRYLSRHGHLWEQKEWREVAASYGLKLKGESNTTGIDHSSS